MLMLPNKRPRLDGGGDDDELSLPVATLLARWWRQKQREAETWMDDELAPLLPQRSASRFGGTTDFSSTTHFSGDGGGSSDGSSTGRAALTPSVNPHTTLLRLGRTARPVGMGRAWLGRAAGRGARVRPRRRVVLYVYESIRAHASHLPGRAQR